MLSKALKADELAQRLMTCLAVDYKFGSNMLIGGMRDGAAVNGAALRQLKFFFPNLMDSVCFSHTIDNVGGHFEFRILDSFTQHWIGLFAHSYNARLLCHFEFRIVGSFTQHWISLFAHSSIMDG